MSDLTAIVPIDLSQRPMDILQKARRLVEGAAQSGISVVFGYNSRKSLSDLLFTHLFGKHPSCTIATTTERLASVNASHLRNIAHAHVKTPFIVLLDVDIWPDFELLKKYKNKLAEGERPYFMLPCLYLTEKGSKDLTSHRLATSDLKKRYFGFSRKEFLHLASPSSVTIMKSKDYRSLGGFDIGYEGHGYEDFDFLVRLAQMHHMIQPAPDMLQNRVARSPLFAVGFRRYLGECCIDALISKDMVFHLHHEKPKKSKYYEARSTNLSRFQERNSQLAGGQPIGDPTLITSFVNACLESGNDISEFSVLFENKPGHIDRYDSFRRRLRFLFNE